MNAPRLFALTALLSVATPYTTYPRHKHCHSSKCPKHGGKDATTKGVVHQNADETMTPPTLLATQHALNQLPESEALATAESYLLTAIENYARTKQDLTMVHASTTIAAEDEALLQQELATAQAIVERARKDLDVIRRREYELHEQIEELRRQHEQAAEAETKEIQKKIDEAVAYFKQQRQNMSKRHQDIERHRFEQISTEREKLVAATEKLRHLDPLAYEFVIAQLIQHLPRNRAKDLVLELYEQYHLQK